MGRRDQDDQSPAPGRRSFTYRIVTLLAMTVVVGLVLAACGADSKPYSHITPRSSTTRDIQSLYKLVFWLALIVFVGVQMFIVYTALRFRQRGNEVDRPAQIHGNKRLEIAWTLIPAAVLLVILIPTIQTMYEFSADAQEGEYVVDVYGKQWWWEVQYPGLAPNNGTLITANEVRVPAGRKVKLQLSSNNVIHSFWAPQLFGKMDVIPGHINEIGFTPEKPGVYYGECTEFCGVAHALMRFTIIVEPQEEFDAWVAAYNNERPATDAKPETGDVADAPAAFGACLACHAVNNTNAVVAQAGMASNPYSQGAGPNLTLFGCRDFIGAGVLANNKENLRTWLRNPGGVKEGNYMALLIKEGTLNDAQIEELSDYLLSLKPAAGCPEDAREQQDAQDKQGEG